MKRWFTILSENQLSVLRILLTFLAGRQGLQHISIIYNFRENSPDIFYPTSLMSVLPAEWLFLNTEHAILLKSLIVVLMIGGILGVLGRFCLLSLSLLLFYVFGFNSAYGIFDHQNSLSSQVIFILALVPGSMVLSLDTVILNRLTRKIFSSGGRGHTFFQPLWGFRLILILVAITYFSSGLSKLRFGGLSWMDGSTLAFYLSLNRSFEYPDGLSQMVIGGAPTGEKTKWKDKFGLHAHTYGNQHQGILEGFGFWLADHRVLITVVSVLTLLLELSSPVIFINQRWRTGYFLGAFLMHTSIGALMGLPFTQYRIICLCLTDWKYVRRRMKTWFGFSSRIYQRKKRLHSRLTQ